MNADALIVTALQLERRAVREHLDSIEVERVSGLAADVGALSSGGSGLVVAVIETGAGNVPASILTVQAEEAFRPKVVAMVGIAAGLKDIRLGDVVASSKIYSYEGGKQGQSFAPRPEFAPVSPGLIQSARAVGSHDNWQRRIAPPGPPHDPTAVVAPVVVGEKVVADTRSQLARMVRQHYGDAVALDMEDYGAIRAAGASGRAQGIAVRGVSDLVDGKEAADARGSQPQAAAHAAAFAMELLVLHCGPLEQEKGAAASREAVVASSDTPAEPPSRRLYEIARELYPDGPQHAGVWERAGGDSSRLLSSGTGQSRWWEAIRVIERGGGPGLLWLVSEMLNDFPTNEQLLDVRRQL